MSDEYVRKDVHEEFVKRMEEEDNRQNHRISKLELAIESISSIATSVERLATNMEHMVREQARQGENLNDQSDRIRKLEDRDGEIWRKVVSHIVISVVSIVIGYIACKLGLQ
jgi:predicted RNase H-like nuclease (RuvC/YqgF family)